MMSSQPGTGEPVQAITIRLPGDVYEELRREAFDKRTSMNALIVDALRGRKARRAQPSLDGSRRD